MTDESRMQQLKQELREYVSKNYVPETDELHPCSGYGSFSDELYSASEAEDALPCCSYERATYVASPSPAYAKNATGRLPLGGIFEKKRAYELDESFGEAVRRLIAEKKISKGDFYARANVNSAWLSNVAKNGIIPKKEQALACCIGLRLSLGESYSLLEKAGYTFSSSNLRDVIVKFFIENGYYDIDELNGELYSYDLVPLGQSMK